jgi:hypothetical protein
LLERLPTHQAISKEEHYTSGALSNVNVADKITVAVAQQPCYSDPPPVVMLHCPLSTVTTAMARC